MHGYSVRARSELCNSARTLAKAQTNGGGELLSLGDSELSALFYPLRPGPKTRAELAKAELERITRGLKRKGVARQLLDRLLHHCVVVNIKGDSYRLKDRAKQGTSAHLDVALAKAQGEAIEEPQPL